MAEPVDLTPEQIEEIVEEFDRRMTERLRRDEKSAAIEQSRKIAGLDAIDGHHDHSTPKELNP